MQVARALPDSPADRARPQDTLATYDSVAEAFHQTRTRTLTERKWLDAMLGIAPRNAARRRCLDLGCGTGQPIAAYLTDRGLDVTGVDGAPAMLDIFRRALPRAEAVLSDMRELALGRPFDAILAWNSFFHLPPDDQRGMFPVFRRHAAPGAALMLTTGPGAGEVWGQAAGAPVYHASLDPDEYRTLMKDNDFKVLKFTPEDPDCYGHSVWLARYSGA